MMFCILNAVALLLCAGLGLVQAVDDAAFQACVLKATTSSCGQSVTGSSITVIRCHRLLEGNSTTVPALRVLLPDAYAAWLLPALERFSLYGVELRLDVRPLAQLPQLVQAAIERDANHSQAQGLSQEQLLSLVQDPGSALHLPYDVWLHPIDQTLPLAETGMLADLGRLVELRGRDLAWQGIAQRLRLQLATYRGVTLAIPLDGSSLLTLYRQDVLAAMGLQVPATWTELLAFLSAYARARQQRLQAHTQSLLPEDPPYALCMSLGAGCSHLSYLQAIWASMAQTRGWQQGMHFDTATGQPLLDTPPGREAFRTLAALLAASAPPEPDETCAHGSLAFARGRCAVTLAAFAPQMRMLVDQGVNATLAQGSVSAARLPGSQVVWAGVGSETLIPCDAAACPHATLVATATASTAIGSESGAQAVQGLSSLQQQHRLVNFAPQLPQSLLAGAVSSRSSPVMQLLAYEVLAYLASPSRYSTDSTDSTDAAGDGVALAEMARRLDAVIPAPASPAPLGASLPPPVSPLVSATPVRPSYLTDDALDSWIQAGYDADLMRQALPVLTESSQHPNQALGLRMADAGYYNDLLEGVLTGITSGLIAVDAAGSGSNASSSPPQRHLAAQATGDRPSIGSTSAGAGVRRGGGRARRQGMEAGMQGPDRAPAARFARPGLCDLPVRSLQQATQQAAQRPTLATALAGAQARAKAYYVPEDFLQRYLASLALSSSRAGGPDGNGSPGTSGSSRPRRALAKLMVVAVVVSVVGGALLVAAGAAAVLRLSNGRLRRLGRRLSRRVSRRTPYVFRLRPSDISVSEHPQVKAPEASSETAILVTDIQSSTRLWESLPTEAMNAAVLLHHACVRRLVVEHQGYESATEGDSFILAFRSVKQAVAFALGLQAQLLVQPWPAALLEDEVCMPIYTDLPEGFPFTHHSDEGLSGASNATSHGAVASVAAFSPLSTLCTSPRLGAAGPGSGYGATAPGCGVLDTHGAASCASAPSGLGQPPTPGPLIGSDQHAALGGTDACDPPLRRGGSLLSSFSLLPSRGRTSRNAAADSPEHSPEALRHAAAVQAAMPRVGSDDRGASGGRRRSTLAAPAAVLSSAAARALNVFRRPRAVNPAASPPEHAAHEVSNATWRAGGPSAAGPQPPPLGRNSRAAPMPPAFSTEPSFMSSGSGFDLLPSRPTATLHPALRRPPLLLASTGDWDGEEGLRECLSTASDTQQPPCSGDHAAGGDGAVAASGDGGSPNAARSSLLPAEAGVAQAATALLPPQGPAMALPPPARSLSSGAVAAAAMTGPASSPHNGRFSAYSEPLARSKALSAAVLNTAPEILAEGEEGVGEGTTSALSTGPLLPPPPPLLPPAPAPGKTLRQLLLEIRKPAFALHDAEGRSRKLLMFRGLRVRVGVHVGVSSEAEVVYNAAAARNVFSGPCVATCKAVADLAHGGQVFLSGTAREALEAATHHHNGGRPAGTLMLHMGTYGPEQPAAPAPVAASYRGAAAAGDAGATSCPSGLHAAAAVPNPNLCRAVSSPAESTCSQQHIAAALPATVSARVAAGSAGDGRFSLDFAGFRRSRSRTTPTAAEATEAAGATLPPIHPPPPRQPPDMSVYWITSPSLSQRLALLPPPRAPPKGFYTLNDVYDAPVGRASYVIVQVPAAATLLAWDERVATEALALFVAEAAEQLRLLRGGYMSAPHPGELCAAFTSAAAAVRWAEGLRRRLLDAPWPQELLEHEMCEPVEVSDSDSSYSSGSRSGSSSSSPSPSRCSTPCTALPSAGLHGAGAPSVGGGDGGGGRRTNPGPARSLRRRLSAVSGALLHPHRQPPDNHPEPVSSISPFATLQTASQHHHHHRHHRHHGHHRLHHALTDDADRSHSHRHHHQHHSHNSPNHSNLRPGLSSRRLSDYSDLASSPAAGGLAAWISFRLSHHSSAGPPSSGSHPSNTTPCGLQSELSFPTQPPVLAVHPPSSSYSTSSPGTPFSAQAALTPAAAAAASAASASGPVPVIGRAAAGGDVNGGWSSAFCHGPSRLGLLARGSDATAQSGATFCHTRSLSGQPYRLPVDVGSPAGFSSARRRASTTAVAAPPPALRHGVTAKHKRLSMPYMSAGELLHASRISRAEATTEGAQGSSGAASPSACALTPKSPAELPLQSPLQSPVGPASLSGLSGLNPSHQVSVPSIAHGVPAQPAQHDSPYPRNHAAASQPPSVHPHPHHANALAAVLQHQQQWQQQQTGSSALELELRSGGAAAGSALPADLAFDGGSAGDASFPTACLRVSPSGPPGEADDCGISARQESSRCFLAGASGGVEGAAESLDELLPRRLPPRGLPSGLPRSNGGSRHGPGVDSANAGAGSAVPTSATAAAATRGRRLVLRGLRMRAGIATGPVSWSVADHTHDVSYHGKPVRTALRLAASPAASGRVLCCIVTCAEASIAQAAEAAASAPAAASATIGARVSPCEGGSGARGTGEAAAAGGGDKSSLALGFLPLEHSKRRKSAVFVCGLYPPGELRPASRMASLSGWVAEGRASRDRSSHGLLSSFRASKSRRPSGVPHLSHTSGLLPTVDEVPGSVCGSAKPSIFARAVSLLTLHGGGSGGCRAEGRRAPEPIIEEAEDGSEGFWYYREEPVRAVALLPHVSCPGKDAGAHAPVAPAAGLSHAPVMPAAGPPPGPIAAAAAAAATVDDVDTGRMSQPPRSHPAASLQSLGSAPQRTSRLSVCTAGACGAAAAASASTNGNGEGDSATGNGGDDTACTSGADGDGAGGYWYGYTDRSESKRAGLETARWREYA